MVGLRSLVELTAEVYQICRVRSLLALRCRECVETMVVLYRIGSEFSIVVRGVVTLNL